MLATVSIPDNQGPSNNEQAKMCVLGNLSFIFSVVVGGRVGRDGGGSFNKNGRAHSLSARSDINCSRTGFEFDDLYRNW